MPRQPRAVPTSLAGSLLVGSAAVGLLTQTCSSVWTYSLCFFSSMLMTLTDCENNLINSLINFPISSLQCCNTVCGSLSIEGVWTKMKLPKLINQVTSCIQIWKWGFNLALFFLLFCSCNKWRFLWGKWYEDKRDAFIPQYGKGKKKKSPLHYLWKLNAMTTF